jgi:hypothetical protein
MVKCINQATDEIITVRVMVSAKTLIPIGAAEGCDPARSVGKSSEFTAVGIKTPS